MRLVEICAYLIENFFFKSLTMSVEWKIVMGYWYDGNTMQFCCAFVNLVETGNLTLCKAVKRCNFIIL